MLERESTVSLLVSKTRAVNCCNAVSWHCGDYFSFLSSVILVPLRIVLKFCCLLYLKETLILKGLE